MSSLLRIFVLLCYVAGGHALPLLHKHDSGNAFAVAQATEGCGCDARCSQENPYERGLTIDVDRSIDVLDKALVKHKCSETCAICIAQVSASGFATCSSDWCIGFRPIRDVAVDSTEIVWPIRIDLTSPRGPPLAKRLNSFFV